MGKRADAVAAGVAGIAAIAFGAGLGELVAGFVVPRASPVATISDALIDVAPGWAKETAIAWFGTGDKIALVVGVVIVLVGVAAVAGFVEARFPPFGRALALLVGVVGAVVAATRPGSGWLDAVPSAIAGIASALALGMLVRRMPWSAASGPRTLVSGFDGRTVRVPVPAALAGAAPSHPLPASGPERGVQAAATPHSGPPENETPLPLRADGPRRGVQAAATPHSGPPDPDAVPPAASGFLRSDRRRFLAWSGGATLLGALGALGGSALRGRADVEQAARDAVPIPAPSVTAPVVPRSAQVAVDGIFPVVTPTADFYRIDTAIFPPVIAAADWSLRIHGLVEEEVTITWNDLVAQPLEESYTTLMCVSNEVGGYLVGNAKWLGYPIRELLKRARPTSDADMVLSTSIDGFTASSPIEALTDDRNAILAIAMNDEALPQEHGFPVRMVVPGLYGYVSATKWVTDLEVTRFDRARAYWTDRGWSERGPVKIESRIDVPRPARTVPVGDQAIAGVAWQQHVGVSKVEVQVDDGDWQEATLATAISDDTWVQWMLPWNAVAGPHTIRCRATNADGETQTDAEAPPAPDGATGWHTIDVTAA